MKKWLFKFLLLITILVILIGAASIFIDNHKKKVEDAAFEKSIKEASQGLAKKLLG